MFHVAKKQQLVACQAITKVFISKKEIATVLVQNQPMLLYKAMKIVHCEEIAKDILQEAYCKAYKAIQKGFYQDQNKLIGWIVRIVCNLSIDYIRKSKRHTHVSLSNTITADDDNVSVEVNMETTQQNTILHTYLDRLPVEQKEAIYLRFFEAMSFKEIADIKGISVNTALGRVRYGISNLKKLGLLTQLVA